MYKQIRDYIVNNITQNKWKQNDKIPSENELSDQFNVSRITVKKALEQLVEDNIIYQIQGKGSFISSSTNGEPLLYQNESTALESDRNEINNKLIACIMPSISTLYSANILCEIESMLSQNNYHLLFYSTNNSQTNEENILREVIDLGVSGIIVFPVEKETYNEEILRLSLRNFPLVLIDRYFRGIETNSVCSDNVKAAENAVNYLIDLDHRNIGIIATSPHGTTSTEDRILGYEKSLSNAEILIDHRLQLLNLDVWNEEDSREKIKSFLSNNRDITAILAANHGLIAIEAATELGIDIPNELSILMFDDKEYSHLHSIPPSCIKQQERKIGQEAAKLLISRIDNKSQERKKMFIPTELIIRNSTARSSFNSTE